MAVRHSFAEQHLNLDGVGLEIGAYDRPFYRPTERQVRFLDHYSTEELKAFAARDGVDESAIVHVDYVVKDDDFAKDISERFDYIIASHVVEHIPDIARWLQNLERLLKPFGKVFLVVPDKRYTFDFLRPLSTVEDIVRCHKELHRRPPFDAVFQNLYLFRYVVASDVWSGAAAPQHLPGRFDVATAMDMAKDFYDSGDRSIHSHVFTSESFLSIITGLLERGLTTLDQCAFYDVWNPGNEFFVALQRVSCQVLHAVKGTS